MNVYAIYELLMDDGEQESALQMTSQIGYSSLSYAEINLARVYSIVFSVKK